MAGLAVFTAASLGCGLATAEGLLISMRFLQGLGAAIVLPGGAVDRDEHVPRRRRAEQGSGHLAVPSGRAALPSA